MLQTLDKEYEDYQTNWQQHKGRFLQFVKWFNENCIEQPHKGHFVRSKVKVNGVVCVCTWNDFRGYPNWSVELTVRPENVNEDAGSGVGNYHKVIF